MYSTHVKNLGAIFDNTFNFYRQLSHITKLLNYQLHSLRLIRHSIAISTATIIASAYILPLFDYCNYILYNTPSSYITKLQILQNSITRCIFNIPKYPHTHISPFLVKLHWLPVRHRILYKTLLLAHKAIHHDSPDYLASLLKLKLPTSTTTAPSIRFYFNFLLNTTYIQPTPRMGNISPILVEHSPHIYPYYIINSQLQETTENLPI